MNLNTYDAPHIRYRENTRVLMLDVLLCMLFLYVMAFYYYGLRVVVLGLVSIAACLLTDLTCTLLTRRRPHLRDISAVVTGMMLPLLMPASVPLHIVVIAAVFGIAVAKHPFGGVGNNVFNPAAAGFSFVAICFPTKLFAYPSPMSRVPFFPTEELVPATSAAFTLSAGGTPKLDMVEMLLGNFPGPMGATNILVIVACLLYLIFRGTVRWQIPVCFFGVIVLVSLLDPLRGAGINPDFSTRVSMMLYELMSGFLLFGGVFLLGDPVTTPKRSWSKVGFAAIAGVIAMLFRRYGGLEEGFSFAVLLMNATVWTFDMVGERLASMARTRLRAR